MHVIKDIHAVIELDERETALLQELLALLKRKLEAEEETLGAERDQFLIDLRLRLPRGGMG